jgi:1-acyl-sn-glycerol-3-phosphate acyltransferase
MLFQLFIANLTISFLLALFVYTNSKILYKPCKLVDKNGKVIDVHKLFDVFHPRDELSFWKLWIGGFINFPFKFLTSLFIALSMKFHLQLVNYFYPNSETDPNQWKKMKFGISFWARFFLLVNGIRLSYKKVDCEKVYKKYLGEDYDFTNDKYSLIISNHIGFFDVVVLMATYSVGLMAKIDVKDYYFVGPIATAMHCLYIKRESSEERKKIFEQLEERQKLFYEGKFLAPLCLFPEGTTSCGRNILKFKKGTFYALLPVKPVIINHYQESSYHLSIGAGAAVLSYIKNFCHSIETLYIIEMPIIRPTEFMFKNYSHLGKEKWEVFAGVTRKIYSEIGQLEESTFGLRDEKKYNIALKYGIYNPDLETFDPHYMDKENKLKEKLD